MRVSRTAGLVVSTVACAALAFGSTGAAIAAPAPASPATEGSAAEDPLPGADKLTTQVKLLNDIGSVLRPVTELLNDVITKGGKLTPEDIAKHTKAIGEALKGLLPKVPAKSPAEAPVEAPAQAPGETLATAPGIPAAQTAKLPGLNAPRAADAGLDLKVKAVNDLRTKVDALLKAAGAGDAAKVPAASVAAVTGATNVVVSIVLGGGLPAPDLAGLPPMPKVPGVGETPKVPGATGSTGSTG